MKILLTLPRPLFPADTGGKIRSLNIFQRLAARVEIHAVSFADERRDAAAISQMRRTFASYTPVPWHETGRRSFAFYCELLASQFRPLPYFLDKCNRPLFTAKVEALLARMPFDLLLCDFLHTAMLCAHLPFRPKVVFEHNVEFILRERKWEVERRPLQRLVLGTEWRKTRQVEAAVCRSFDHVLSVSENDKRALREEFAIRQVSVVPTGVDTEFFSPGANPPIPGRMVFVGSMDWDPNEDGMTWFLREIHPLVRRHVPGSTLAIVGRNPSPRLQALAAKCEGVEVTGWVADARPHLDQAEVVVVPLRVGSGTRIKIPEAMAMGRAVVSTTVGAEGLPFLHDGLLRLANRPEDFAGCIVELLRDRALRYAIGSAARMEMVANYSWNAAVDSLTETLEQVISSATPTVAA